MRNIIEKAIEFASLKHDGQMRKSTNIPYITHPFNVGMILQQAGYRAEVVAAGLLHDSLEDTSTTEEELREHFGEEVLSLVLAASEPDKSLSWEERKQHTIDELPARTDEEVAIIVADKLHNLRSILDSVETQGDVVWSRFNRGKEQQIWYYTSIWKALEERKEKMSLILDFEKVVLQLLDN